MFKNILFIKFFYLSLSKLKTKYLNIKIVFERLVLIFKYYIKSKHKGGHGVHSPFAFNFINNVIEESKPYYCFEKIENQRQVLLKNKSTVDFISRGVGPSGGFRVCDIAHKSLLQKRYAQLLFRVANSINPKVIVELGTSLGLTTAYLASLSSASKCYTFDASVETTAIASKLWADLELNNIETITGDIDETLPLFVKQNIRVDFVFFDANHTKEATLNYFKLLLPLVGQYSIFVFDDISYSKQMQEAWLEIIESEKVRVSFNLFQFGIVIFNPILQKQDYVIRY